MAKAHAVRRRLQDKCAMGRYPSLPKFWSLLVLLALALLAAACTGQRGRAAAGTHEHGAWDDDEEILQRRQAAMGEAVRVFSEYNPDTTPPRALKRAVATLNGELAPLQPMLRAIGRMPEARAKEEARAELLTRHFGQLLPGASIRISNEQGRILAHLSGGSGADFTKLHCISAPLFNHCMHWHCLLHSCTRAC